MTSKNPGNVGKFSKFEDLFKHNSTNTIRTSSSDSTPSNPNILQLTVRVSLVIDMHLRGTGLEYPSDQMVDAKMRVFNDAAYWKEEELEWENTSSSESMSSSVSSSSKKKRGRRESEDNRSMNVESSSSSVVGKKRRKVDFPSIETICIFLGTLGSALNFSPNVLILALIYVNRLLVATKFALHVSNWRSCMLGAIICAHKMWEDKSLRNVSFSIICPMFTIAHINDLEIAFLSLLGFRMHIASKVYAQYYFELRNLVIPKHLQDLVASSDIPYESHRLTTTQEKQLEQRSAVAGQRIRDNHKVLSTPNLSHLNLYEKTSEKTKEGKDSERKLSHK